MKVDAAEDLQSFKIQGGKHINRQVDLRGRRSASYFFSGSDITGGKVTVEGCGLDSIQGDNGLRTQWNRC